MIVKMNNTLPKLKILSLVILVFIISTQCVKNHAIKKSDLEKENLKGDIKTIKERTYKASLDNNGYLQKRESVMVSSIKYDSLGDRIKENIYYYDLTLNGDWDYKYDSKGNKIKKNWYDFTSPQS